MRGSVISLIVALAGVLVTANPTPDAGRCRPRPVFWQHCYFLHMQQMEEMKRAEDRFICSHCEDPVQRYCGKYSKGQGDGNALHRFNSWSVHSGTHYSCIYYRQ
ncbi:uncharacterized protein LY79DRAFT_585435 [Colletotrichum navitas]|uniref:Uncharacterized protein n=1 Tax=Colletotrichum navitas TaxID=681940 RepID=A0AAD8UUI0_9PEZI|nr:uncharacterized protein LY79DRAFT_585435 [Colletotrichum navitas]KAK1561676.1 hypothetical protein LY79DRAFT_585435 [Colletotrichum navitas]